MKRLPGLFSAGLLSALLLGVIMRGYQLTDRFLYTHDNDLNSWIVKDIVVDRHFRLIGQQTSAPGIFIGPLFYYSLIPFYLAAGMDPAGSLYLSLGLGLAAVASLYRVVSRLHSPVAAKISAFVYAASELISRTEREVVPTTPVMLWSIWAYYAAGLVFQGKKQGLWLGAVLFSLVWHLNLALILLLPVFAVGFLLNLSRFKWRDLILPAAVFIILSTPLWLFEFRHGFIQTRALTGTLVSAAARPEPQPLSGKLGHVTAYALKNANRIFWHPDRESAPWLLPAGLLLGTGWLLVTGRIHRWLGLVLPLWLGMFVIFFTFHPINLSEYYLNGMNIIWLIGLSLILAEMYRGKPWLRLTALVVLGFIIYWNLGFFLTSPVNASGYRQRRAVAEFIAADAAGHNYPCVSVSYITNPGYELGYRYFFYMENLHVNQPKSGAPVYTIVFPHPLVNHLDMTFGALGLILPDYNQYLPEAVKLSCAGANANLTDPMFGFTR